MQTDEDLRNEAHALARYLVGSPPEPVLVDRWVAANRALFTAEEDRAERSVFLFAIRHPRTLPWLDAAAGLVSPHGLLRRKVLVCCALLEASPRHVRDFAQVPRSHLAFALELGRIGVVSGVHAALGLLLLPFARRSG